MNSAGIARRGARRPLGDRPALGSVLLVLVLAAGAFMAAFEAGHLSRHGSALPEAAPTSFRVAAVDGAIPLSLQTAPPIDLGAEQAPAPPSSSRHEAASSASAGEGLPTVVPSTPSTAPAVTSTPSTSSSPPATPSTPAATPSPPPASTHSGGGGKSSHPSSGGGSSGGSFDTSG